MNKVLVIIGLCLLIASPLLADEIEIPFAINKQTYVEEALQNNFDLTDGEFADGFIESKGSRFVVYTYRQITPEQLDLLTKLTWKHLRK